MPASRRWFLILLWILAAANIAVLIVRLVSIARTSYLVQVPNGEAIDLYAIWKLRHGYPLYELVTQRYFALTPYNYLFYYVYAAPLSLLRVSDEASAFAARIPTLVFALAGAWSEYRLVLLLAARAGRPAPRTIAGLLALATWIGCGVVGWSALSVRPDVGAGALATAGLWLCAAAERDGARARYLAAGALFACAWLFKQSFVMLFAGAVLYLVVCRRAFLEATLAAAPFVAVAALSLALGSAAYRFDLIVAQTMTTISVHDAQFWLRSGLIPNLLIWAMIAWSAVEMYRQRRLGILGPGTALVVFAFAVSGLWCVLTIGREGASTHYFIEPSIPASALCALALSACDAGQLDPRRGFRIAAWTTVPMVVFVLAILFRADTVRDVVGLRARGDRLVLGLPGEFERRKEIADRMQPLPPPVYVPDEALSLPWFSNGNRYPGVVTEHVVFDAVRRHGLVADDGVPGLIRAQYFGSALLQESDLLTADVRAAGYRRVGAVPAPAGGVFEIYVR